MNTKWIYGIPIIIFFGLVVPIGYHMIAQTNTIPDSSVLYGKNAPELPIIALHDGLAVGLDQLQGKPVVINFMASWCAPCRAEIPALDQISDKVSIVAIAYKDEQDDTAAFLSTYGNPYEAVFMDRDGSYGMKWGIYGVPETFVIDKHHIVRLRHAGPVDKYALDNIILPALEDMQ